MEFIFIFIPRLQSEKEKIDIVILHVIYYKKIYHLRSKMVDSVASAKKVII